MKISELIKLLQKGIDVHGDHEVWMLDDHCSVGLLEYRPKSLFIDGGNLFCLNGSRETVLDIQVYDDE